MSERLRVLTIAAIWLAIGGLVGGAYFLGAMNASLSCARTFAHLSGTRP